MKIRFYEVPSKESTFGDEEFLIEVCTERVPSVGECVGFEEFGDFYDVVNTSTWFNNEQRAMYEILIVKRV